MSYHMSSFVGMFYQLLSIGAVAAAAHYYMLILIPLVFGFCIDLVQKAIPAITESSKLTRLMKSPILSSVQDTMVGASTIRVFGRTDEFILDARNLLT